MLCSTYKFELNAKDPQDIVNKMAATSLLGRTATQLFAHNQLEP